jgi:hypothetical protein
MCDVRPDPNIGPQHSNTLKGHMKIRLLKASMVLFILHWEPVVFAAAEEVALPLCADIDAKKCRNSLHFSLPGEFETYVAGRNRCYMAQGYFPKRQLENLLPESMSIPDNSVIQAFYPETKLQQDTHPFMLSFCHGSGVHDVFTKINVPEQEEIMFVIPVLFKNEQGEVGLFSYVPVLYLDSFMGVVGGLYFGLRKEYHPGLEAVETPASKRWHIDGLIDASFKMKNNGKQSEMPQFIEQIFTSPFVSMSYPVPFSRTIIYQARIFPELVADATATFHWQYEGVTIESTDDTWGVYSEYRFDMSFSTSSEKYFEGLSQP